MKFYVEVTHKRPYGADVVEHLNAELIQSVARYWFRDYDSAAQFYATHDLKGGTSRLVSEAESDTLGAPLKEGPVALGPDDGRVPFEQEQGRANRILRAR
jgi:hypothetical protein